MSAGLIAVHLCVNDSDSGAPTGQVCKVEVDEIELESPYYPDRGPVCRRADVGTLRVGRRTYPISSYTPWVGNWCWDVVTMERADARRLVAHLIAWGFMLVAGPATSDLYPPTPAGAHG